MKGLQNYKHHLLINGEKDMTKNIMISASTHPVPFEKLGSYASELENLKVEYLHCDLMDGEFVLSTALSAEKIIEIGQICDNKLDVHLMADNPQKYLDACLEANAEIVTVHYEAFKSESELKGMINSLRINGIKAGISIKPSTPISQITNILQYVDLVLVMSVEPGASGQSFMLSAVEKIHELYRLRALKRLNYIIEVDGGINGTTAEIAINAGADMLVSGSYLYNASDKISAIEKLKAFN